MSGYADTDVRHWARSVQKTTQPAPSAARGLNRLATVTEPGSRQRAIKLPKGLADSIYEQGVLTAPGVAEGFERANKTIEDWKRSL